MKKDKQLENLDEWLIGFSNVSNPKMESGYVRIAQFRFPTTWDITIEESETGASVVRSDNDESLVLIVVDGKYGYDVINEIAHQIIHKNQENDAKANLLKEAIVRLEDFFSKHSLSQCSRLKFSIGHKEKKIDDNNE